MRDDFAAATTDGVRGGIINEWLVCGWFTPDYRPWADKLIASLEAHAIPYDLVEVPKLAGSWEDNTMAKPAQLLAAIERHSDKTIVLLDVDCEVRAPLDDLIAGVSADLALHIRVKRRRNGAVKWGAIRSGTMIVRPTLSARAFVERWILEGKDARYRDVDQDTLMLALKRTPWVSFTALPIEFCATAGDKCAAPVIFHSSASAGDASKLGRWQRWINRRGKWFWCVFSAVLMSGHILFKAC